MLEVLRQVHRGHAAPAELALDSVAVGQGILQAVRQVRQRAASGSLNQVNLAHGPAAAARPDVVILATPWLPLQCPLVTIRVHS